MPTRLHFAAVADACYIVDGRRRCHPPKVSITSQGQLITHSPNIYLRVSTLPHRAMQSDVAAAATLVLLLRLATCDTVNFYV